MDPAQTLQLFTIKDAAAILGLSIDTLRRYDKIGALSPIRTLGNQRRYTRIQLEEFKKKKGKKEKPLTISEASKHLGVSIDTLRRYDRRGILSPDRSPGNQRRYLRHDVQSFLNNGLRPQKLTTPGSVLAPLPVKIEKMPLIRPAFYSFLALLALLLVIVGAAGLFLPFEYSLKEGKITLNQDLALKGNGLEFNEGRFIDKLSVGEGSTEITDGLIVTTDRDFTLRPSGNVNFFTRANYIDSRGNMVVEGTISASDVNATYVNASVFRGSGLYLSDLNAENITYGTLSSSRLASSVSLLGQHIESSEIYDGTISNIDLSVGSYSNITSLGVLTSLEVKGNTTVDGKVNLTAGNLYQIGGSDVLSATTLGAGVVSSSLTSVGTLTLLNVSGRGTFTNIPTLAHSGTWAIDSPTWNISDSSLYINPASVTADSNVLGIAVAGGVRFAVDAEGDIYGRNLVLTGSTTTGATTIAGDLGVEGSITLGDSTTDTFTINPATLTFLGGDKSLDITGAATRTLSILNSTASQVADLNLSDGSLFTGGTSRLTNAGALQNIAGYTQVSGNFSISGTGTFSTGTGTVSLNGNTTVDGEVNLTAGNTYQIGGSDVLSATALGTGVVSSSLTSVGTIGTGVWNGTALLDAYISDALTIAGGTITNSPISGSTGSFTTLTSSGATTIGTGSSLTNTFGSGASSINTIGSITTPGALTLHGATTLDNTFTVSGSNLTSLGGNLTVLGTTFTASSLSSFDTGSSLTLGTTTLTLDSNSTINGGSAANTDLTLQGTSNATRTSSYVYIQPNGGNVAIGWTGSTYGKVDVYHDTSAYSATAFNTNTLRLTASDTDGDYTGIGFSSYSADREALLAVVQTALGEGDLVYQTFDGSYGERFRVTNAGNFGIGGDLTPDALFNVGSTSQFQVNSSGAIAAATGISSSGTINFSGLTASSAVYTDGSKNLTSTAPTSGAIGYWSRAGTTLSPTTAGDSVDIGAAGNFVAGQTTGKVGFGGAVSGSDYLALITANATQDWSRALSVTQANDSAEDHTSTAFSNTGFSPTLSGSTRNLSGIDVTLAPSSAISVTNIGQLNMSGINATLTDNGKTSFGTNSSVGNFASIAGINTTVTASPIYSTTATAGDLYNAYASANFISGTPTLTNVPTGSAYNTYGVYGGNSVTSGGNANLTASAYGIYMIASGDLTTTGTTAHYGGYFNSTGTADNNYGLYVNSAASATNNYGLYINTVASAATNYAIYSNAAAQSYFAGNVGIGVTNPNNYIQVKDLVNFDATTSGTFIGYRTGYANSGLGNVFVGYEAGFKNTIGDDGEGGTPSENTAVGFKALRANTTGYYNSAFGNSALTTNIIGTDNSAFGYLALQNTTTSGNSAFGSQALASNTTGGGSAFGYSALSSNTIGVGNDAFGSVALGANTTGSYNAAFGGGALNANTTGQTNSAFGGVSLNQTTRGRNNVGVGYNAGTTNIVGGLNTLIGTYSDVQAAHLINASAIGARSYVAQNDSLILGSIGGTNTATGSARIGIGTTTPLSALHVTRPVNANSAALGKSLAIFDQIENQDILTASASGNTRLSVTNAGHVLPGSDDAQDLGSTALRWRDQYLGPGSLHIGTSTTDEGTISYDTSGNILNFGTDSTTNADIAFFTDDLYLDKSSGNVGIGTTAPGRLLDVAGFASVNNNLIAQIDGGMQFGRVGVTQNQFAQDSASVGVTWTARDSSRVWFGVAVSSDGKYQTAVVQGGQIYTSTDYGVTWTARDSNRTWQSVAMSSDGKYQTAVDYTGQIYTSTDYGVTWTARDSSRNWYGAAVSSDGKYQTAVVYGGQIYTSTDYGVTWTARDSSRNWQSVAISSDGKYQTAVVYTGQIYTSTDYGVTWTARDSSRGWNGVAMSSDGKYQTAVVFNGQIYTSTDYGVTWTARDSSRVWQSVAISSDGKYQTATVYGGQIYTSSDYGVTWTARDSNRNWQSVAMSSDGKYQTAPVNGGQIYTSYAGSYMYGGNLGIGTTAPSGLLHVSSTGLFTATGGTITQSGGYTIHTFTSSGTFTPNRAGTVEYLVVGGGGQGGRNGGGGAGGLIYNASYSVSYQNYSVVIGAGGNNYVNEHGANGTNSSFASSTAIGGGGGAGRDAGGAGGNGGSGGGGGGAGADPSAVNPGSGTAGQGSNGGSGIAGGCEASGGGGGGAGAVGSNASANVGGNGGVGLQYSQFASVGGSPAGWFAGGGGGAVTCAQGTPGTGGNGGGGAAGNAAPGVAGTANTGGGGGAQSAVGGSGIVIIRYLTSTITTADSLFVNSTIGNIGIGSTTPESMVQITGGGLCVGSDANCNTDNNTEGVIYSSSTSMTVYDVAENYPTRDISLVPGEVVTMDTDRGTFVVRSSQPYDSRAIGAISAEPGVLLGGFNGKQFKDERQVAVALTGRVLVRASSENGPIKQGDYVTSSGTPGKIMKATRAGPVIGQALEDWDEERDSIMVFIKATYHDPDVYITDSGNLSIAPINIYQELGIDPEVLNNQTNKSIDRISAFKESVVGKLRAGIIEVTTITTDSLNIKTDQIMIGEKTLAEYISDNSGGGLASQGETSQGEALQKQIAELKDQVASISAVLGVATASDAASLQSAELQALRDSIVQKEQEIASLSASSNQQLASSSGEGKFDNLRVTGSGLIEGVLTVLDTLNVQSLIVNGVSTFFGEVIFKDQVKFQKGIVLAKDNAGVVTVEKGSKSVKVVFSTAYDIIPVVNATLLVKDSLPQNLVYGVKDVSERGFTLVLNRQAEEDVEFSWIAITVAE